MPVTIYRRGRAPGLPGWAKRDEWWGSSVDVHRHCAATGTANHKTRLALVELGLGVGRCPGEQHFDPPVGRRCVAIDKARGQLDPRQHRVSDDSRTGKRSKSIGVGGESKIFFRHLKQTFERRKLRSKAADNAQVEADWSLLGLWTMALHAEWKLAQAKVPAERISFAAVLRAYRTAMREYKSRPDAGEDLSSLLRRAWKDEYVRTSKASRDYPRKKDYGPPPGPPEIVQATRAQRRLAREVKREQELRLTA